MKRTIVHSVDTTLSLFSWKGQNIQSPPFIIDFGGWFGNLLDCLLDTSCTLRTLSCTFCSSRVGAASGTQPRGNQSEVRRCFPHTQPHSWSQTLSVWHPLKPAQKNLEGLVKPTILHQLYNASRLDIEVSRLQNESWFLSPAFLVVAARLLTSDWRQNLILRFNFDQGDWSKGFCYLKQ